VVLEVVKPAWVWLLLLVVIAAASVDWSRDLCNGECSEAKDQVEQLSNVKECIVLLSVVLLLWPPFVGPQPGSVYMTYL
jgi:hypothetical protein